MLPPQVHAAVGSEVAAPDTEVVSHPEGADSSAAHSAATLSEATLSEAARSGVVSAADEGPRIEGVAAEEEGRLGSTISLNQTQRKGMMVTTVAK